MLTLQILFAPATNALDRPGVALRVSIAGGLILPCAFLAGIGWGVEGLAWAWVGGMASLLLITATLSLPVIRVTPRELVQAATPVAAAAGGMALLVWLTARVLPPTLPLLQLITLATVGLVVYPALLALIAPSRLLEAWELIRYRRAGDIGREARA